jgi:hypothetical protein
MADNDITVGEFAAFLQFAASGTFAFSPGEIAGFFSQIRQLLANQNLLDPETAAAIDFAEDVLTAFFAGGGSVSFDINATIAALAAYPPSTPLSETAEFGALFEGIGGPGGPGDPPPADPSAPDFSVGAVGFKAFALTSAEATATYDAASGTITITGPGVAASVNVALVQRIVLEDGYLGFDFSGNAGQAYRLYEATFDRTPDDAGLGFWIRQLDDSGVDLLSMARLFLGSSEFVATYGGAVANADFVGLLYQNILGRDAEAAGLDYWTDALDGGMARETVLASFSESAENVVNVGVAIEAGIFYV